MVYVWADAGAAIHMNAAAAVMSDCDLIVGRE